jgi:O-antigen/teichoic acid export membrane protein
LAARASRAVLWNLALIPVQGAVALLSSAVVARALSTEQYALYGLALAALTSLLLWTDLGLMAMVSRYAPLVRELGFGALRSFFRRVLTVRAGVLAVTLLLLPLVHRWPPARRLLPLDQVGLWLLLAALAGQGLARVSEYFLSGLLERGSIGAIRIVVGLAHPLLVIAAVTAGWGVPGVLAAIAAASLLDFALFGAAAMARARTTPGAAERPTMPADIRARAARFAAVSYLEKLASHLNSAGFAIFLVAALGARAEVAPFAVAGEFASRVLAVLAIPFSGLTLPLFATVEARRPQETGTAARLYLSVMILLCLPAAGLLWALAEPLVTLVYSARYQSAAPILRAFVPFLFVEYAVYSSLLAPLLTRERYREVLRSKLPMLAGLCLMLWAIPRWGATGAALAYGAARVASAALLLRSGLSVLDFRFPLAFTGRVAAATVAATAAAAGLRSGLSPGVASLIVAASAGGAAFFAVYRLLGGMDREDKERLAAGARGAAGFDRVVTYFL